MATAALALLLMAACDEKKEAKDDSKLLEVIELHGTCKEDHATVAGDYDATVMRYETQEEGQAPRILTYGFAQSTRDFVKDTMEELKNGGQNAGKYYPPFSIDLFNITLDTSQSHWVLHGMSSADEGQTAYAATCDLTVVKRGMEIPKPKIPGIDVGETGDTTPQSPAPTPAPSPGVAAPTGP
jgi:hypothetical protein